MFKLNPLNQPESLSKMAYKAIRSFILSGEMSTDKIYNEMQIANDLKISRTPVREALLELSSQGLITFLPRKGIEITKFTAEDVEEIFEIRKAIELATVEKLGKIASSLDFDSLNESLNAMNEAADKKKYSEFVEFDRIFHMALSKLTGNRRIEAIMRNIRDILQLMALRVVAQEGRMEEVIKEHEILLESIKQGKPVEARVLMEQHLEMSKAAAKVRIIKQK